MQYLGITFLIKKTSFIDLLFFTFAVCPTYSAGMSEVEDLAKSIHLHIDGRSLTPSPVR